METQGTDELDAQMAEMVIAAARRFCHLHYDAIKRPNPSNPLNPYFFLEHTTPFVLLKTSQRQENIIQLQRELLADMHKVIQDQKELTVGVLNESKTVTKLTKLVVALTAGVFILTVAVVVLTWLLLAKGG